MFLSKRFRQLTTTVKPSGKRCFESLAMVLGVGKLLETYLIMIQNMQVKFEKSSKKNW